MITLMAIAVGSLVVASGVWIYFTIDEHRTKRAALREINLTHMRHMARMQMNNTEFMMRMGMNTATFPSCSPSRNALTSQENPYVEVPTGEILETMYRQQIGMNDAVMDRLAERAKGIPAPIPETYEEAVEKNRIANHHMELQISADKEVYINSLPRPAPIPAPEVFVKTEVKND